MNTYSLRPFKIGGKILYPKEELGDKERTHSYNEFCLDEYLLKDEHGRLYSRYRLHTREPYQFFDTMEFDIKCPKCGTNLRLCGNPHDLNDHGLYKCRKCDERVRK